jgi:glycosyltransferase involved in cell wall biosynthesis
MQSDKIKLLKFVTSFYIGGTERQFVNLSRAIDPSRFDLHLACLERRGDLLNEIDRSRIPVSEYPVHSLYQPETFRQQLSLAGYLRRNKIQILHSYNFYSNVFAIPAARLAGVPVTVAAIRDMGPYLTPMKKRVHRFVCRFADSIVVNAEAIRKWLIAEGYSEEKITVIRNGIDFSRFREKTNGASLRRELGLPPRAPLVLLFSRLNPLKGIEYFLQSASIVAGHFPEARFLIVGDAPQTGADYIKGLKDDVARLGLENRVIFTGFRLDTPELLSEAAVSVLPSLSEGLSNTLLESMAAGVPVVATNVGGNTEVVEEGVTGLLVPPRDPEAIAHAVCLLLKNPELASSLGRAGKKSVIERFSLDRMVRETEGLYLKLIRKEIPNEEDCSKNATVASANL